MPDDPANDIHEAFRHPLRRRILAVLWRAERSISPSEISDLLDVPLSNVSYHVRLLKDVGGIVYLSDSEQVRGSVLHFYSLDRERITSYPWAVAVIMETEVPVPLPSSKQAADEDTFNRFAEVLTAQEKRLVEFRKGWNGRRRTSRAAVAKAMKTRPSGCG